VASNDLRINSRGRLAAGFFAESHFHGGRSSNIYAELNNLLYEGELAKERREIKELSEKEKEEIRDLYRQKGFSGRFTRASG